MSWASDPFGKYQTPYGSSTDATEQHFTNKERDSETGGGSANGGNDYFGARYYSSTLGRFLGSDPKSASGHAADPQTWNRYVYARNNPLAFIDPDGKEYKWAGARDADTGRKLITALVIAYMTNGRFQTNFDTVAQSKSVTIELSDADLIGSSYESMSRGELGEVAPFDKYVQVSNGVPASVSSPLTGVEKIDTLGSVKFSTLEKTVQHETEHAMQLTLNPLQYVRDALKYGQYSNEEYQAKAAGADTSPAAKINFGDAMQHVLDALHVDRSVMIPQIEVQHDEIRSVIPEE